MSAQPVSNVITLPVRPEPAEVAVAPTTAVEKVRPPRVVTVRPDWVTTKRHARGAWPYVKLAVCAALGWPFRGAVRAARGLIRWLTDAETRQLRAHYAGAAEGAEYARVSKDRGANLRARLLVSLLGLVLIGGPILAWTQPDVLAGIVWCGLAVAAVMATPGNSPWEYAVWPGAGLLGWYLTHDYFGLLPMPPTWAFVALGAVVWVALLIVGRPSQGVLAATTFVDHGPAAPTMDMVIDALCSLGVKAMNEKAREQFAPVAPGVARTGNGWVLQVGLPSGATAQDVMKNRMTFAGNLARPLSTVIPSMGAHPGILKAYIAEEPMNQATQAPWPLADGHAIDVFAPQPMFTDVEGRWVDLRFIENQLVIGGLPGYGKTFAMRSIGAALALDPRTRLVILDGKGWGDMDVFKPVAHAFFEGDEPEELAEQLAALREIREEMRRRRHVIKEADLASRAEAKVTSQLVDARPELAPIVILVDEVQVYTEAEDKKVREAFIEVFADFVRRGRAAGIIPVFATQKPSAEVLPSKISHNCATRLCFRVTTQTSNDQVLGSSMHSEGIRATEFTDTDKGLAWLVGAGAPRIVRSVHGIDVVATERIIARARQLREERGLLTGQAAGEERPTVVQATVTRVVVEEAAEAPELLADARSVMDRVEARAMHSEELLEALSGLGDPYAGMTKEELNSELRAHGIPVKPVYSAVAKDSKRGIKRSWLDPDGGAVVDLTARRQR